MARLQEAFFSTICDKGVAVQKKGGRCDLVEFMGMQRSAKWVPPVPGAKEGPVVYGLQNSFCTDCYGCFAVKGKCSAKGSSNESRVVDFDLEYLPMEFSRDRELQSTEGATTQATIAAYLRKRSYPADAIIINQGVHDLEIEGLQVEDYVQRVHDNLQALKSSAQLIVWLFTSFTLDKDNEKIAAWNHAVHAMIAKNFSNVFILDSFQMSQVKNMHKDSIHMIPSFYVAEAQILMGFLSRQLSQEPSSEQTALPSSGIQIGS